MWSELIAVRGKPGTIVSDNGRMRDELLNKTLFTSLAHAREKIAAWARDYNTGRPYSSLCYASSAAFAADLKKQGAAQLSNNNARALIITR